MYRASTCKGGRNRSHGPIRVLCGKFDVAWALRETRECVDDVVSVLDRPDRLDWFDRFDDWLDCLE